MKNYILIQIIQKYVMLSSLIIGCTFMYHCDKKTHQEKIYNVGIVSGADAFVTIADGFKTKMTELGYKNIHYDLQKFNDDMAAIKQTIGKFVEDKVDLIFVFPTEPAIIAKLITQGTNIPVVFAMAGLEGNNLVESVPKPGGNITGVRFPGPEATVKRLEILHELMPQAKRILITYDPNYPNAPYALAQLRPAASAIGIKLIEDPILNLEELRGHLQRRASLVDIGAEAILIMPDILTHTLDGFNAILKFSEDNRVPIGGGMAFTANSGALFSFAPDNVEMGIEVAIIADKIFKGTPAGSIMVVTPDCHLRLNYKVIQELGLTVNEGLLSRAKEIIR